MSPFLHISSFFSPDFYTHTYIYIIFFSLVCAVRDLIPHLGIESVPPAFEART